jgi:hypothetical protein
MSRLIALPARCAAWQPTKKKQPASRASRPCACSISLVGFFMVARACVSPIFGSARQFLHVVAKTGRRREVAGASGAVNAFERTRLTRRGAAGRRASTRSKTPGARSSAISRLSRRVPHDVAAHEPMRANRAGARRKASSRERLPRRERARGRRGAVRLTREELVQLCRGPQARSDTV